MTEEQSHEHAQPPDPMTEPCSRYFRDHWGLMAFVGFVSDLAIYTDKAHMNLLKGLVGKDDDGHYTTLTERQRDELKEKIKRGGVAVERLRSQRQLILEMMLCRAVDNCLTYVSDILALIFHTKPETLKSSETIRLDALLQHESMDELISTLAERRVERLAYQGMSDLSADLSERLGFNLFEKDEELERAIRIVEMRNLIVHNRAAVNRRFLFRIPNFSAKLGDTLELNADDVFDDLNFLAHSCSDIDGRAASKFGLPQPILREQLAT